MEESYFLNLLLFFFHAVEKQIKKDEVKKYSNSTLKLKYIYQISFLVIKENSKLINYLHIIMMVNHFQKLAQMTKSSNIEVECLVFKSW